MGIGEVFIGVPGHVKGEGYMVPQATKNAQSSQRSVRSVFFVAVVFRYASRIVNRWTA